MMMEYDLETISIEEVLIRTGLAVLFGFVFGFDRSLKNKPVDFRVYIFVCVTACLTMITCQEVLAAYPAEDGFDFDIFRVVNGVMVGIGFLGGGAIIKDKSESQVVGTATGAAIWASASIGIMLGFGFYTLAVIGFVVVAATLVLLGFLRKPLLQANQRLHSDQNCKD